MEIKVLLKTVTNGKDRKVTFEDIFFDNERAIQALNRQLENTNDNESLVLVDRTVDASAKISDVVDSVLADFA